VNHKDQADHSSRRRGTLDRHKDRAKEMIRGREPRESSSERRPGDFAARLKERVAAKHARRERGGDHAGL
jgi:hypothetical protein